MVSQPNSPANTMSLREAPPNPIPPADHLQVAPDIQPAQSSQATTATDSHSNSHTSRVSSERTTDDIAPWNQKFLLTLDGGGIRGYSTLLIIEELMKYCKTFEREFDASVTSSSHPLPFLSSQGSEVEQSTDSSRFLPVHYFDYIAGTSTGGLIAIMLGRLRMTINDCIKEYERIGGDLFGKPRVFSKRGPIPWNREKFDHHNIETAIRGVITRRYRRDGQIGDLTYPSNPERCRVIVVAVRENNSSWQPFLFRTYEHPQSELPNGYELNPGPATSIPVWQVARATTAAPTYFKPLMINNEKFLDGGWGDANNPTWHALREVSQMHASEIRAVALTLSIGTGTAKVRPVARFGAGFFEEWLAILRYSAARATDSENTHVKVMAFLQELKLNYQRFNVDGLGNINLGEWKVHKGKNLTLDQMKERTRQYLDQDDTSARLKNVARELVSARQRRSRSDRWDLVATGRRYRCAQQKCHMYTLRFATEDNLRQHLAQHHSGYVWPATTDDERERMSTAVMQGTIPFTD